MRLIRAMMAITGLALLAMGCQGGVESEPLGVVAQNAVSQAMTLSVQTAGASVTSPDPAVWNEVLAVMATTRSSVERVEIATEDMRQVVIHEARFQLISVPYVDKVQFTGADGESVCHQTGTNSVTRGPCR
jgi:hypothetical protein